MRHYLTGPKFIEHIAPMIGVESDSVRRVIIDAAIGSIVLVYVELIGDTRLYNISADMMAGVQVKTGGEE